MGEERQSGVKHLALVAQKMDSSIQQINHYVVYKYLEKQFVLTVESDFSGGLCYPPFWTTGASSKESTQRARLEAWTSRC